MVGNNGPPPYAITPEDHTRYHELFLKTDVNHDGKVAGKEAVELFRKSGLPQDVLKNIWAMADHDKDNFLSPKVRIAPHTFAYVINIDTLSLSLNRNFVLLFI